MIGINIQLMAMNKSIFILDTIERVIDQLKKNRHRTRSNERYP
jgi:hypothetical protein